MNHECCASLFKDEFQELNAVATQSVLVHDHNLWDAARADCPYQGAKALALEVEAGSDVRDDAVPGASLLEVFDLTREVFFLGGAADPCIGDLLFCPLFAELVSRGVVLEEGGEVLRIVKTTGVLVAASILAVSKVVQPSCVCPGSEGLIRYVVELADTLCGQVSRPRARAHTRTHTKETTPPGLTTLGKFGCVPPMRCWRSARRANL